MADCHPVFKKIRRKSKGSIQLSLVQKSSLLDISQEGSIATQLGWLIATSVPSLRTPVTSATETVEEVWSPSTLRAGSTSWWGSSPTTWAAAQPSKVETSRNQQISSVSPSGAKLPNILTFVPPVTDWIRDNADTGRFCSKMTDSQREGGWRSLDRGQGGKM